MDRIHKTAWAMATFIGVVLAAGPGEAQVTAPGRDLAANVIVPQAWLSSIHPGMYGVSVKEVDARVKIVGLASTTVMDIVVENPGGREQEAELVIPVPDGSVVRGFEFEGQGKETSARLLDKKEAERLYREIVSKRLDPAILEFAGFNMVRSAVFPVPAGDTVTLRLTYENLLDSDGKRVDYYLPRSESVEYEVPWKISMDIKGTGPVASAYSPSHEVDIERKSDDRILVDLNEKSKLDPGPFRLCYLLGSDGMAATFFAYPDPQNGGGYFLYVAGLPAFEKDKKKLANIKRELTLVIDTSGSMGGEKIEQVKKGALQVVRSLGDGEHFNIIAYNDTISLFSSEPVKKDRSSLKKAEAFINSIQAGGGTNLHDALVEALRQKPAKGALPIVLFMTDGLPTVGEQNEVKIREAAEKTNTHERRVFTFGVGYDVNTPLLDKISLESRAKATYVLPGEDVEVKVSSVFKKLTGPVLASPDLELLNENDKPAKGRVRDLIPADLPDLFEGDQLVLLGKYIGGEPLTFKVSGNFMGKERSFSSTFGFEDATVKNGFVARLWASRKIAVLIDEIRQKSAGASAGGMSPLSLSSMVVSRPPAGPATEEPLDPEIKELIEEVVRLSKKFGILTEYTAFFADDGVDLADIGDVMERADRNFKERAMDTRSGMGAVNQSLNMQAQMDSNSLNMRNSYFDANMNEVEIRSVQSVNDNAFYKRGGEWIDSRLIGRDEKERKPDRVIEFASDEYFELAEKLAERNQQSLIMADGDLLIEIGGETVLVKAPDRED